MVEKNGLCPVSHPAEWARSNLATDERNLNEKRITMLDKRTTHANVKSLLCNADQPNSLHPNYEPFVVCGV